MRLCRDKETHTRRARPDVLGIMGQSIQLFTLAAASVIGLPTCTTATLPAPQQGQHATHASISVADGVADSAALSLAGDEVGFRKLLHGCHRPAYASRTFRRRCSASIRQLLPSPAALRTASVGGACMHGWHPCHCAMHCTRRARVGSCLYLIITRTCSCRLTQITT